MVHISVPHQRIPSRRSSYNHCSPCWGLKKRHLLPLCSLSQYYSASHYPSTKSAANDAAMDSSRAIARRFDKDDGQGLGTMVLLGPTVMH
jgi:hypothetical protein